MLDSFPAKSASDDPDPDGYEPALAAALCSHPREVAEDCADAKVGVVQECMIRKALTAGRVNDWCRRHSTSLREYVEKLDETDAAKREAARLRAEMHDDGLNAEERRAVIERFRARLGPNFGLKRMDKVDEARAGFRGMSAEELAEAHAEADRQRAAERLARDSAANQRSMLAEYAAKGFEPVCDGAGRVRSYEIVAAMNPGLLRPAQPQGFFDAAEEA